MLGVKKLKQQSSLICDVSKLSTVDSHRCDVCIDQTASTSM